PAGFSSITFSFAGFVGAAIVGTAAASETGEDDAAPVTATASATVPPDGDAVEPVEEMARLPDDPGVDPDEEDQKPRKFRLF
ncbi:MAG: heme biosynthesis protein HemY, partial [Mesorhizobium sp.]